MLLVLDAGPTPAVAIFSVFSRYKRESSRASVFAAKVLNEAGIRVTMKVCHFLIYTYDRCLLDYISEGRIIADDDCYVERSSGHSIEVSTP